MNKTIYLLFFIISVTFAEMIEDELQASVDCLILEDENSIICKYEHERMEQDREIMVKWINPSGEISRERTLLLPAGHGSIYDFRYIEGRMKGIWQFKVSDDKIETSTTFEIQ